jgi:hypothetical protein
MIGGLSGCADDPADRDLAFCARRQKLSASQTNTPRISNFIKPMTTAYAE